MLQRRGQAGPEGLEAPAQRVLDGLHGDGAEPLRDGVDDAPGVGRTVRDRDDRSHDEPMSSQRFMPLPMPTALDPPLESIQSIPNLIKGCQSVP